MGTNAMTDMGMVDQSKFANAIAAIQLAKADRIQKGGSWGMLMHPSAARTLTAEALGCAEDDARVDDALENVWTTINAEDVP